MERDFEKDIIELDAAIKSNAERENTFTLSVLQRAKEIILQQKEKLKAYEDIGLMPEEILDGKMLTGWIQVAERLPEKNATYCLVTTTRSPRIEMAWYLGGDWYWNNSDAKMGGVIAWRPLPEPYRPEALREAGAKAGQNAAEQVLQSAT